MIRRMQGTLLLAAAVALGAQTWSEPSRADAQQQSGEGVPRFTSGGECSPMQTAAILDAINRTAIEGAELAMEKSQSEDVHAFAQKAIDAHTRLQKELRDALDTAGVKPEENGISLRLETEAKQSLDALESSKEFDRDYAAHEVLSHARDFGLFHALASRSMAQSGAFVAVSSVFTEASALFEAHQQDAMDLESKVAGPCGAVMTQAGAEKRRHLTH